MKQIIKVFLLVFLLLGMVSFLKKESDSKEAEPFLSFRNESGGFTVKIREKEKEEVKIFLRKIKNLVYKEATVHNPAGDLLPDGIDDAVIKEVKETVN